MGVQQLQPVCAYKAEKRKRPKHYNLDDIRDVEYINLYGKTNKSHVIAPKKDFLVIVSNSSGVESTMGYNMDGCLYIPCKKCVRRKVTRIAVFIDELHRLMLNISEASDLLSYGCEPNIFSSSTVSHLFFPKNQMLFDLYCTRVSPILSRIM